MSGLLKGVKIIDLSRLLPGPFGTQILGDMGAEILKVEEVKMGDYIRWMGPANKQDSGPFLGLNRNKKSLKLNLQSEEGKEILKKLIAGADVVIEQFRPGVMDKLGLGYEDLKKVNPGIIMCSLTGYGQSGPYKKMAGHDINYLGVAGVLDVIGNYQGNPVLPGIQIADIAGGSLWVALGVLAALYNRAKTGQGEYIDVAMTDAVFTFNVLSAGAYFIDGQIPERGNSLLSGAYAWYNIYPAKDGKYIGIGALEEVFWKRFCTHIGREDFIAQQFAAREVQEEMMQELTRIFAAKTADEWMEELGPLDACIAKINNLEEAINDEHLKERGMIMELDHPVEGKVKVLGFPVKFTNHPCQVELVPPAFGQHSEEVLSSLGYTKDQISEMKEKGII